MPVLTKNKFAINITNKVGPNRLRKFTNLDSQKINQ